MKKIKITSGRYTFIAKLEEEKTPESCRWLLNKLPYKAVMIQAAWSGNAVFAGIHGEGNGVPFEHATSYPIPGQILMYPDGGGEIYIAYGSNCFACPTGQLAGNPFLTIIEGAEQLVEYGQTVRMQGAHEMWFEALN